MRIVENDCWWLLKWTLVVATVVFLLLFIFRSAIPAEFQELDKSELSQLEELLSKFGPEVKLTGGKLYTLDGTKFVKGKDNDGDWIFVIGEIAPGTTIIRQYPVRHIPSPDPLGGNK